jgi:hypothetical protein
MKQLFLILVLCGAVFGQGSTTLNGQGLASGLTTIQQPINLISITVQVNPVTQTVGQSVGVTATGNYSDGSSQDFTPYVSWTSSNTSIATIAPRTTVQNVNCVSGGSVQIIASYAMTNGSAPLTCTTAPPPLPPTLNTITLAPTSPTQNVGQAVGFTATGHFSDGSTQDLTGSAAWISGTLANATLGAVTTAKAVNCIHGGTSLITAAVGIVNSSTTLTCVASLVSVAVQPTTPSLNVGSSLGFLATGTYNDGTSKDVTPLTVWTSGTPAVATLGTLGAQQNVKCVTSGSSVITATLATIAGNTTLSCVNPPPTLTSLVVTPASPSISVGQSAGFIATGTYSDGSTKDITNSATWTSATIAVATVGAFGDPQPINCKTAGTSQISAAVGAVNNHTTLTCVATLSSIEVDPPLAIGKIGLSQPFTATGTYSDGSVKNVSSQSVWSSSNTAVASLSGSPTTSQSVNCVSSGSTVITAVVGTVSGSTGYSCTVIAPTLLSINVTPANPSVNVNTAASYIATGTYSDGTTQNVTLAATWGSSSPGVVAMGSPITNPELGTCKITGSSNITATIGTVHGSTTETCVNPLVSLAISPSSTSVTILTSASYIATGTFFDGSTQNLTLSAVWSSSNTAVASVSSPVTNPETVLCNIVGTATITATVGTISVNGSQACTAVAPLPTLVSISVAPTNPAVNIGQSASYLATGHYNDNSTQDLTLTAVWAAGSPSVVTVQSPVTKPETALCAASGSSTVTATVGAIVGSTTQTCVNPLVSISVSPASPTVNLHSSVSYVATGTFFDGTTQNVTSSATWVSGSPTIVTMGSPVTNPELGTCNLVGSSVITATVGAIHGNTTQSCVNPLVSIAVTPATPTVNVGQVIAFIATGTFSDGSQQNVTQTAVWASGTPSHATLGPLTTTQAVNCVASGTSVISATIAAVSGNTTVNCVVPVPTLVSIAVTPALPSVQVGSSIGFIATGTFSDSSTQDVTASSTWNSASTGVATLGTLSTQQIVICGSAGTSVIRATIGAVNGSTTLTCLAAPPPIITTIAVTPSNPSISVGSSFSFIATATFSDSSTSDVTKASAWASGTPTHATLGALTTVQSVNCIAAGTSAISATVGGISGNTTITCIANPVTLVSIAVSPLTPTQYVGSTQGFTANGTYSDGTVQNVTVTSTWASGTPAVASLGALGTTQILNCLTVGSSVVSATIGAVSGNTTLACATRPAVGGVDLYCPAGSPTWGSTDATAQLPLTCYNTSPASTPSPGTVRVATAATWTSVWAATLCGDVVEVAPGTVLSGQFVIPALVCDAAHYRTLRPTGFATNFPAYGTIRGVSPHHWGVSSLPGYPSFGTAPVANVGITIQSTGTGIPLTLTAPTSYLKIQGTKITRTVGGGYIARLIKSEVANMDHIVFDSDWAAGTATDDTQRVLTMNGISNFAWVNGLATDFHCVVGGPCSANQAFSGGYSTLTTTQDHTWKIVNNYITSADNTTVGLGGGAASNTPADIEFRLNWGQKLQIWNPLSPTFFGTTFVVKQSLESKNSDRFFVEANVFDGVWAGFSQIGSHILFTPKNQAINGVSVCSNCFVTNFTVRYNFFTTSNNCFQIANAAGDAGGYATAGNSYSIHDNVCENTNYPTCYKCGTNSGAALDGGVITGAAVPSTDVLKHVFVNHNSYIPSASAFTMGGTLGVSGPLASSGLQMTDYTWTNNLILREPLNNPGSNPINNPSDGCSQTPVANCFCGNSNPTTVLNACFTTYKFGGNALVNGSGPLWPGTNCTSETSLANIFVNYNGGFNGPAGVLNYAVKSTSPCHNTGLDGKDPGADVVALSNAIAGVASFR